MLVAWLAGDEKATAGFDGAVGVDGCAVDIESAAAEVAAVRPHHDEPRLGRAHRRLGLARHAGRDRDPTGVEHLDAPVVDSQPGGVDVSIRSVASVFPDHEETRQEVAVGQVWIHLRVRLGNDRNTVQIEDVARGVDARRVNVVRPDAGAAVRPRYKIEGALGIKCDRGAQLVSQRVADDEVGGRDGPIHVQDGRVDVEVARLAVLPHDESGRAVAPCDAGTGLIAGRTRDSDSVRVTD